MDAPTLPETPVEELTEVIREAHREELANLRIEHAKIVAQYGETIETQNCRLISMEQQNGQLRTQLTIAQGELIKLERQNIPPKGP